METKPIKVVCPICKTKNMIVRKSFPGLPIGECLNDNCGAVLSFRVNERGSSEIDWMNHYAKFIN